MVTFTIVVIYLLLLLGALVFWSGRNDGDYVESFVDDVVDEVCDLLE